MWNTLIPFLFQLSLKSCVLGDGNYECGDHGRFEYCIDEIPGCVIGCHCHPGYYFDTDTKICQPNSKLIEHHRRNKASTPSVAENNDASPNIMLNTEAPVKSGKFEGSVDEITKDANDLGDWLYNQFFKTIENQVINSTNEKDIMTRRSGSQSPKDKPKRKKKLHKSGKSSKQKGKKEQLRRKLLRITENDSLFDISSKSSSESSDSSSSDLSSMEYEVDENSRHKHDNDEHGHKKIVMINKKPKQPLPSFIFLPNLDTPYYPPIGLPPPPIVPMYPMVPVPPVPLCPITGCTENADNTVAETSYSSTTMIATVATTTAVTTIPTFTTASHSDLSSVPEITADPVTADEPNAEEAKNKAKALRVENRKKKNLAKLLNKDKTDDEQRFNNMKYMERQKILDRLKEKISGNPSAMLFKPSWNKKIYSSKFINKNPDAENTLLGNGIADDEILNSERNSKLMREDGSYPDSVDFKYITELIHHVDLNNKSNDLPPIDYNPLDSMEKYEAPTVHNSYYPVNSARYKIPEGRRKNHPLQHKTDDFYYANLGRQIASMIRGIDAVDTVGLVKPPNETPVLPPINDHFYNKNSPKSFWERYVRSPLAYFKTKNKKFEYLKRSNELLFDIENKVEIIASTEPSLTLQEIENIVKLMEAAKKDIHSKDKLRTRNQGSSHNNLNVDLLPQKAHDLRNSFKNNVYSNEIPHGTGIYNYKTNKNSIVSDKENFSQLHMHNSKTILAGNGLIKTTNRSYNTFTTIKPSFIDKYFKIAPTTYNLKISNKVPQMPAITNSFLKNKTQQSSLNQHINPYFLDHRYFEDNDPYYVNPNVMLAHFPPGPRVAGANKPSYYFSEINNFEYMH